MNPASLTALISLPLGTWALSLFSTHVSNRLAASLRSGLTASTKRGAESAAQSWALGSVAIHLAVLAAVIFLPGFHHHYSPAARIPWPVARQIVAGFIFGLAIGGVMPLIRQILPKEKRFRMQTLIALGGSVWFLSGALATTVLIQEYWRVICLRSLIADGHSNEFALVAVSLAYGIAFAYSGLSGGITETFVGAVFAAIYLWSGSFVLVVVARLALQFQYAAILWASAPSFAPGDGFGYGSVRRNCPNCGGPVYLNVRPEPLRCSNCRAVLSPRDSRASLFRWGGIFIQWALTGALFFALIPLLGRHEETFWVAFLSALPAFFSVMLVLQVVFPPKLQLGLPDFVGLNLHITLKSPEPEERELEITHHSGD
jgi:hypothetical protein